MSDSRAPPPAPSAPDPADCCGQGCSNCVFDQHEAAMRRWRQQLERVWDPPPPASAGAPGPERPA